MPEADFARDTLEYVRLFLKMGVTDQWFYRMLIGRMYYAAHHLGRRLLTEAGLRPEQWQENIHQRVIQELRQRFVATGRMTAESLGDLNGLRDLRRTADYDLRRRTRMRDTRAALALLSHFANECFEILEVS